MGGCGHDPAPPHICPFRDELLDDLEPCTCCVACESECRDGI